MPYLLTAYPECREASIVGSGTGSGAPLRPLDTRSDDERQAENQERGNRRSRGVVRRYMVHNQLAQLLTLTYADEPGIGEVSRQTRNFVERAQESGLVEDRFPYLVVAERGSKTGRLHLHMAVNWWESHIVEACERCGSDGWLDLRIRKGLPIPPAGSACVGCIWGHGFVGRPNENSIEHRGDPRMASVYVVKMIDYITKNPIREFGKNRYRRSHGFNPPEPISIMFDTIEDAEATLMGVIFKGEAPEWRGERIGKGPVDIWSFRWAL